jgi:hypothetical protein
MTNGQTKTKQRRGTKPKPTTLQSRAIFLIRKALLGNENRKLPDLLLEAGYSEESVRQWTNMWLGLKPHIEPIVADIDAHRTKILTRMNQDEVFNRASYGELARGLQITTHVSRLLSGKSTQNFALSAEHRHRLEQLLA